MLTAAALHRAVGLHQAGDLAGAEAAYRAALAEQPGLPEAHCNLGILLHQRADLEGAARHLSQAVALYPGLAAAWNNLGVVLRKLGRGGEAVAALQRAIALQGPAAATLHNLSLALRAAGRMEEALEQSRRAAAAAPGTLGYALEIGNALLDAGRTDEAIDHFGALADQHPGALEAHRNLGVAARAGNRPEVSETAFRSVLAMDPGNANAHVGLAEACFLQGRWREGFQEYEWRLARPEDGWLTRQLPGVPWRGEPLAGRRLLVYNEQGLGDGLQFARYLGLLAGGSTAVWIQDALVDLVRSAAPGMEVVPLSSPPPPCEVHASLLSLGLFLDLPEPRDPRPYLEVDPAFRSAWAERFLELPRPRIGLCWRGNPRHPGDRNRSIPLECFRSLVSGTAAGWVGLQVPPQPGEEALLPGLRHFGGDLRSFQDSAGALANLDLLISVDTSLLHLAGAMGVEAWALLPFVPDWRWMLDREDTVWYSSLRLFRQDARRDWAPVLAAVERALPQVAARFPG